MSGCESIPSYSKDLRAFYGVLTFSGSRFKSMLAEAKRRVRRAKEKETKEKIKAKAKRRAKARRRARTGLSQPFHSSLAPTPLEV